DVLASIFGQTNVSSWEGDATLVNAFARGTVFSLPAGPLDAVIGAEHESSSLERGFDHSRHVSAAFTEIRAPLIAGGESRRELVTLSGAARYDDYSDFGNQVTWQAGLEVRPIDSLLIRATRGTAFKPPTLYNLAAPLSSGTSSILDPLHGR